MNTLKNIWVYSTVIIRTINYVYSIIENLSERLRGNEMSNYNRSLIIHEKRSYKCKKYVQSLQVNGNKSTSIFIMYASQHRVHTVNNFK